MRKQTKLVAVLSAAALLAIGASMTSYAKGWNDLGNGDWEYLDSDGERVTGEWRRSSAGFCYLDDDGLMARNRLVTPEESGSDDYYYVNDTGERRTNAWAKVQNEEEEDVNDREVSVVYYYLGSNGKAFKSEDSSKYVKKIINWMGQDKTFFFDEMGRMVSGWVQAENSSDGKVYYCGDEIEGYAYTSWHLLEVPDFMESPADNPYEDWEYFCFESNGKMRQGDATTGNFKVWYDSGWYYTFDLNGVYQDDWYKINLATAAGVATTTEVEGYTTYSGIKNDAGWVLADRDDDGENSWYYLVPYRASNKTVARNVPFNSVDSNGIWRAKVINKKTYLFDENGKMKTGLQDLKDEVVTLVDKNGNTYKGLPGDLAGGAASKELKDGIYYFSEASATKGQMLTKRQAVTTDGETSYYYFADDGHAYQNTMIDNVVYGADGKRIQAEDGNTYAIVDILTDVKDKAGKVVIKGGSQIIVNSTGKVTKRGTKRTVDGLKCTVTVEDGVWGYTATWDE